MSLFRDVVISGDFVSGLELLSEDEVELGASDVRSEAIGTVETVSPVDTHQSNHRQEDADTDASRTLDVEGVEVARLRPGITAFEESESVDGGVAEQEGIAQFE